MGIEHIFFTRGVPAIEALPAMLISQCMQAALESPDGRSILQYGQSGGYLPLRELLAEQYHVSSDQVLIGNGSLHLQDLLAATLVHPGDVVLVEQPSYDRAIKTFRRRGAKVIGITLEEDGINLEDLENAVRYKTPAFLYVIPDFQNPAGVSSSLEKRQALVEMAERYDFWLLEDVPYHALRYSGEPLPLLRNISHQKVLTLSSYSKLISPALRVGYMIGPADLIQKIQKLTEDTILTPVLPSQAAVFEFHRRGYFLSNLERLKQLYAPRLQTTIAALKRYLPNVPLNEPEGGFFVSITLPKQVDCTNLQTYAQQVGLFLTDGRGFFADPFDETQDTRSLGERFVRIPFCALTSDQLVEGIKRLAGLIGE